MAVSRRSFIGSSVATAISCSLAPLAAFGAGRQLPRDNGIPARNGGNGTTSIPEVTHAPQTPEQRYSNLAGLTRDSFQSAIGSAFKVSSTSGKGSAFWLRLLSVKDPDPIAAVNPASMAVAPPAALVAAIQTKTFSLGFSGGPVKELQQETFFFEHPQLGQFALFIVPAGPQQYTAVINRLPAMTAIPV
jgi:hypothetical protein